MKRSLTVFSLSIVLTASIQHDTSDYRLEKISHGVALPHSAPAVVKMDSSMMARNTLTVPLEGSPECPCLSQDQFTSELNAEEANGLNITSLATYGVGCRYHDVNDEVLCANACQGGEGSGFQCQKSWCNYAWCWVDPNKCSLESIFLVGFFQSSQRYYSYATCRYPDVYTHDFSLFGGDTLNVGLASNTGGWRGSYSSTNQSFVADLSQWSGPTVDYIRAVGTLANLTINSVTPPEWLKEKARSFFGNNGNFDFCVYAATLGFLDLCVGEFTITEQRASVAEWISMDDQLIYMVSQDLGYVAFYHVGRSRFQSFWDDQAQNIQTIFQPFTPQAWMFTVLGVIPFMALLFLVHDYGKPGSPFPTEVVAVEEDDEQPDGTRFVARKIPLWQHALKSIYVSMLSVLQTGYLSRVVSLGGKIHLLGFGFFVMAFLAVYTANLAAILTRKYTPRVTVSSFKDAVAQNLRFCADRQKVEVLTKFHADLKPEQFVVDPVELGGDGKPGFACKNCQARTRVFEFIDAAKADAGDELYCHAALAPLSDLEIIHSEGRLCSLSHTKEVIGRIETGFPIYAGKKRQFSPVLLRVKNNGMYLNFKLRAKPVSKCPPPPSVGGKTNSLGLQQLAGIWTVSFGLALAGLLVRCIYPSVYRRRRGRHISYVVAYDQNNEAVDLLERDDEWIQGSIDHSRRDKLGASTAHSSRSRRKRARRNEGNSSSSSRDNDLAYDDSSRDGDAEQQLPTEVFLSSPEVGYSSAGNTPRASNTEANVVPDTPSTQNESAMSHMMQSPIRKRKKKKKKKRKTKTGADNGEQNDAPSLSVGSRSLTDNSELFATTFATL